MRRHLLPGVAALLAIIALTGCSSIHTLIDTDRALRDAGYQSVNVSPKVNDNSVDVQVTVAAVPSSANAQDVARIVWGTFRERFDQLRVTVHGQGQAFHQDYTFAQMEQSFGARNPAWNHTSVKSGAKELGVLVIVGILVLAGLVVGTVLLIQRRNRRRRPPFPGGPGGPFPGGGYPGPYPSGGGYPGPYPAGGQPGPYPGGPYGGGTGPGGPQPGPPGPPGPYHPPPSQPPYTPPPAAPPGWRPPPEG